MSTFYCFIATGKSMAQNMIVLNTDDQVPQLLGERFPPASKYESVTIGPDEWKYPEFGPIDEDGANIDWNALWNAAFSYLVERRGVSPDAAKAALDKTAAHQIGTFVPRTSKVTFGVPVADAQPAGNAAGAFSIKPFARPSKYMKHMFHQGVAAPVMAEVSFVEPAPTAEQITEAKKRVPAKQKRIGNTFVKKPEDLFGLFISEPFFNSYNLDYAADLKGDAYEKTTFPFTSVDYAMRKLAKRVPYEQDTVSRDRVSQLMELFAGALKVANLAVTGKPEPEGIYNCYTTVECQNEPFSDDVIQLSNNEYIIIGPLPEHDNTYCCYQFSCSFYALPVGKAYAPLHILPAFSSMK